MDYLEESIFEIIRKAIRKIYIYDKELLNYNIPKDSIVCERTLSTRLAIYLQESFSDYNVDCEYNRNLDNIKKDKRSRIFPDVIIHKRKKSDYNLVWIEVKKTESDPKKINKDRKRLKRVTLLSGEYKYRYGILIIFDQEMKNCKVEIYENGIQSNINLTNFDFCDK